MYALVDARAPNLIRYVGKTVRSPRRRLAEHLKTAETGKSRCAKWIRSVQREGGSIQLLVLCSGVYTADDLNASEREMIKRFQSPMLTNLTAGGDGGYNEGLDAYNRRQWSDEEREAHARRMRVYYQTHDHPGVQAAVAGSKAAWQDASSRSQRRQRISEAQKRYWASLTPEEVRERATDPGRVAKISSASRTNQSSPEYRVKMAAAVRKSWTPERRAAQAHRMREQRRRQRVQDA